MSMILYCLKRFRDLVLSVSGCNAEPNKHGKWVDCGDFEQCSACKGTKLKEITTIYGKAHWIHSNYCGNCGAKMDMKE